MSKFHEAVIIGGGPAGLTAGIYLRRVGIDAVLVERGVLGGTAARADHIENYPGFPEGVSGIDLMNLMAEQANRFGLTLMESFHVSEIRKDNRRFLVKSHRDVIETLGIIVATGTEWKQLGIPGEKAFTGKGVSYCATCDAAFFEDLEVAVIGGGDSAIQEALTLAKFCKRVFVVHRRDQFRAQKVIQERAFMQSRIEIVWNQTPIEVVGKEQVKSVLLQHTRTGKRSTLKVDGVFIFVGLEAKTGFLGDLVDRDSGGFIITDENLSSRTRGLFIAGDARQKKLRQITTAVGDGAQAAMSLEKYISEM